jgi:hypothetical protein
VPLVDPDAATAAEEETEEGGDEGGAVTKKSEPTHWKQLDPKTMKVVAFSRGTFLCVCLVSGVPFSVRLVSGVPFSVCLVSGNLARGTFFCAFSFREPGAGYLFLCV